MPRLIVTLISHAVYFCLSTAQQSSDQARRSDKTLEGTSVRGTELKHPSVLKRDSTVRLGERGNKDLRTDILNRRR